MLMYLYLWYAAKLAFPIIKEASLSYGKSDFCHNTYRGIVKHLTHESDSIATLYCYLTNKSNSIATQIRLYYCY